MKMTVASKVTQIVLISTRIFDNVLDVSQDSN